MFVQQTLYPWSYTFVFLKKYLLLLAQSSLLSYFSVRHVVTKQLMKESLLETCLQFQKVRVHDHDDGQQYSSQQ